MSVAGHSVAAGFRSRPRSAGRQTTTVIFGTMLSLALAFAAGTSQAQNSHSAYSAAQRRSAAASGVTLRPVPRLGSVATRPPQTKTNHDDWNLKWRPSSKTTSPSVSTSVDVFSSNLVQASAVQSSPSSGTAAFDNRLQVASGRPDLHPAPRATINQNRPRPLSQAAWITHSQQPAAITTPSLVNPQANTIKLAQNFFSNPFGDDSISGEATNPVTTPQQGELLLPPTQRAADPALPSDPRPMNDLRSQFDELDEPPNQQEMPADDGPSLGDMMRENRPDEAAKAESPSQDEDRLSTPKSRQLDHSGDMEFDNPFKQQDRQSSADAEDRDRLNSGEAKRDDSDDGVGRYEDDDMKAPKGVSCTDFRDRIKAQTIDQVSLDISEPYRPDEFDIERYEKLKADFDEKQVVRQWRTIDGRPLVSGRLRDLAYEKAVVQTEHGTMEELPIDRLSEADLAYISESWGLPKECRIEQAVYTPRNWVATTMTWKASNLCHTPLYFEDVNLERYGHTRGPFLEPLAQTAHFFGNVVVLPYKMGVHCPTECQYSLGYYRPGNCAPWIVPPVPLSLKGAYAQAAFMTGAFWLIP